MPSKNSREANNTLSVAYSSKPMSGWGGLVSIWRFFDAIGVRQWLAKALPDGRTSNNQVPVVDMVMQFMATVLTGGSRFAHVERVRDDAVIRRIVGASRFGAACNLTRYFRNFFPGQGEHLHTTLSTLVFEVMGKIANEDVLDLDSTVFLRHGSQQGSTRGYNPLRRKVPSHHPLIGMLAKTKLIAHAWLRAGAASPRRGCNEFLVELLSRFPKSFRITAVRADSGFYSDNFLSLLEEKGLPYAVVAIMSRPFSRWCSERADWENVTTDLALAEGAYYTHRWSAPRRMIIVRKAVRRETKGVLFEIVGYEYHAVCTSLTESPLTVWRFYNQRGDCENRIKELKNDFNASGFCMQSFTGTEAAFRLVCFTFNLVSLFKALVLLDTKLTLGTIRNKLFVVGAAIGSSARRAILRLGLQGIWKRRFAELLERISSWTTSTASQWNELLLNTPLDPSSSWALRRIRPINLMPY